MKAALTLFAALSLAALSLGGCKMVAEDAAPAAPAAQGVKVQSASVRLNPNPVAPSAAYFTIIGGAEAETLTRITSPDAKRVEMHESRMEGGLMTMAAVDHVEIPARGRVAFRQGGRHAMLFGISAAARTRGTLTLNLDFAEAPDASVVLAFPPQAAGAPAPPAPTAPPAHVAPAPRPPVTAGPAPAAPPPTEADHSAMDHGDHDH